MADESRVAKRYAAALYEIAVRDKAVEKVLADVTLVAAFLADVPYLRTVIYQPLVSGERKRKVVNDAFASRVSPTTLNFLLLMVRKRREAMMELVIADYKRRVEELMGRVSAEVHSAVPLSQGQIDRLTKQLSQHTGKTVTVTASVDPKMIGGLLIRMGDQVIDGTVRTSLEKMRQQLLAAR